MKTTVHELWSLNRVVLTNLHLDGDKGEITVESFMTRYNKVMLATAEELGFPTEPPIRLPEETELGSKALAELQDLHIWLQRHRM